MPKTFFYVPFDGGDPVYTKAYRYLDRSEERISIQVVADRSNILWLPLGANVIVEAISSISWHFFLRMDLNILHAPRGGASLKIGWKTLRRNRWHVKLRLKRRNHVLFRNSYIGRYYGFEEETCADKILIGEEVVDRYMSSLPKIKDAVHISLSECWSGEQLAEFVRKFVAIEGSRFEKVGISIHPATMLDRKERLLLEPYLMDFGNEFLPGAFITDCVSSVFLAEVLGINILVVPERQTLDRALFIPQESIFCLETTALPDTGEATSSRFYKYKGGSSPLLLTDKSKSFAELLLGLP